VSGRVFLITESGDLKPARLANVYLLLESEASLIAWRTAELKAVKEIGRLMDKRREAIDAWRKVTPEGHKSEAYEHSSEAAECREELQADYTAFEDLLKWGADPKNRNQLLLADADEEGNRRWLERVEAANPRTSRR